MNEQIQNDLISFFSNEEEYKNITIKDKYEKYPEISYPMITIEEMVNEEVNQYTDDSGENVSYLAYQFEVSAKQSSTRTARENVKVIRDKIDSLMKNDTYRCLRRITSSPITPMKSDNNIMVGYLRYDCHVDIKRNVIYRRY